MSRYPRAPGICLLACLLSVPSMAAINAWSIDGPGGGWTTVVAPSPSTQDLVLAGTIGGMYRSTDGGATWTLSAAPYGSANNIAFDPGSASRILAANNYIIISEDAGRTFTSLPTVRQPPLNGVRELHFNRDGTFLYASVGSGHLYRTPDLGVHWTEVTGTWPLGSETLTEFSTDPNGVNTLFVAVTGAGIYKSTNAGTSWALTGTGPGSSIYNVNQIIVKPGDAARVIAATNDGIYVSSNGGTSWTHVPGTFATYTGAFNPLDTTHLVLVMSGGTLAQSLDGGDTFGYPGVGLEAYYQLRHFEFDPVHDNKKYLASGDGPLIDDPTGQSWARSVNGIRSEALQSFSAADDGTIYSVFNPGPAGLFRRSATGGWEQVNHGSLFAILGPNPLFQDVATFGPSNGNIVWVVTYNDDILRSDDGGLAWYRAGSPLLNGSRQLRHIALHPTNPNIAYIGSATDGIWKTEDGFQWTHRSTGLPNNINSIRIDPSNPQIVYAGATYTNGTSVFKSVDGGVTWQPTGPLPQSAAVDIDVDPQHSNVVYIALPQSLYRSDNGGTTWAPVSFGDATPAPGTGFSGLRTIHIDRKHPSTLIGTIWPLAGGFVRSVDSGATWTLVDWPTAISQGNGISTAIVDPSNPGRVFTGGFGVGIAEFEIANDLKLEITGTPPARPGASATLTVSITNLGGAAASPSELLLTLPAFISAAPTPGCAFSAPVLTCGLSAMRRFEGLPPLSITLNANAAGVGNVDATLVAHETDPVTGNNHVTIAVSAIAHADLGVSIGAGTRAVTQNGAVSLSVTITNAGPNAAANSRARITIPAGLTFATATATGGTCTIGAEVSCTLGDLAAGASTTIALSGTAVTVGTSTVTATSTTDTTDDSTANDAANTAFTISAVSTAGGSAGGGGKKGGGATDWLSILLLGTLAVAGAISELRPRGSARR